MLALQKHIHSETDTITGKGLQALIDGCDVTDIRRIMDKEGRHVIYQFIISPSHIFCGR